MTPALFVSCPAALSESQRWTFRSWCGALRARGLVLRALTRDEYTSDPWPRLEARIRSADGVVLFGFRQMVISAGRWRCGTDEERQAPPALSSPWIQVEAGLALSAGLPVLALAERGVAEGIFDPATWGTRVLGGDLSDGPDQGLLSVFGAACGQRRTA